MASSDEKAVGVMKVGELAAYLRVRPTTIYRRVKRCALPAFKVGSHRRFNRWCLDQTVMRGSKN
jgi:excisionase family DNA binding protein